MTQDDLLQEVVDRSRRIETRLTGYLAAIGYETGSRKPIWMGEGIVEAPSYSCSLTDCLAAVPEDWDPEDEVQVVYNGRLLGWVSKPFDND